MNKNSYQYYKIAYRANKRYKDLHDDDNYGQMLSKAEWQTLSKEMSTKEIVYNQFHFYTKEAAHQIQKSLKQEGFKLSIKKIQQRDYTPEMYQKINETYHELRSTMSGREAAMLISYTYYGS